MDAFLEALEQWIIKYWYLILMAVIGYLIFKYNLQYGFIGFLLPIFAVILLGKLAWKLWIHYIQQDFISGIDFVLLEIIPPREVLRSPKAMELFFTNALYHWSNKGGMEAYWQGAVWFWFSLEIVSIDGQVHFFVRTPTRTRGLIETQMYAQYPQAQVREVEDYTLAVDKISPESEWNAWGCEWGLDKHEAYPLRTYVDYGLDKDPKEEFKVDPISSVIELFGSLKKGEQIWMQIVVRPPKKQYKTHGTWFGTHDWVEESKQEIDRALIPYTAVKGKGVELGSDARIEVRPPDFFKTTMDAAIRKRTKLGFETGIRTMYVAKKDAYDANNRRNMRLIFRQYSNPESNALSRATTTGPDAYGGIFMLSPEQSMILADRMLHEYRERGFFYLPLRHSLLSDHAPYLFWPISYFVMPYAHPPTFVLNVEELATLWHFPGQILQVPTLERIESKEAAPPTNLPI